MLSKAKNLLEKHGLRGAVWAAAAYAAASLRAFFCPALLLHPDAFRRALRRVSGGDYARVILWRSPFGFHAALYQRPQQLARQFARLGCLVLYEANPLTDRVDTLFELEKGLLLFNGKSPLLRHALRRALDGVDRPKYLQVYSTDRTLSLCALRRSLRRGWRLIYEYVDALDPVISGTKRLPKRVQDKYDYVMARKQLTVVVTAEALRQDVLRQRGEENLVLASNGVDGAFFRQWEPYEFEPAFRRILARGRPVVCYYGALAAWLDYDLLRRIAAEGMYSLVLIGVKYDASFDRELRGVPGIDFLGPRDYRVLKYYARAADVLILPFRLDAVGRAASPVKLFEYMALQKPIVSTDIDECRRYKSVLIARDRADFLRQLRLALTKGRDEEYLALLEREARANDWQEKAKAILRALPSETAPGA